MKTGTVTILGRPNSGKSTVLNACVWEALAPVSQVPNTTRVGLRGIYTSETEQIVFTDTPGLQTEQDLLAQKIRKQTLAALKTADVILRIIDSSRAAGEEDAKINDLIGFSKAPVVEVYTKCDLPSKREIPSEAIRISKDSIPVQQIIHAIATHLQEGNLLYDPDFYTDTTPEDRIGDIVREQALLRLQQEIPHALYVRVEDVEDTEKIIKILAYVIVERDSQKRIVIGKRGSLIQEIGTEARKKLEELYEKPVFLQLRVDVERNWTKNPATLASIFDRHA